MNLGIVNKSVGSIVTDNFAAARVFKRYGIDFCCGGTMTLEDACRLAGVCAEDVVRDIESVVNESSAAIPFDSWPTDLLIDYVLKIHHRGIRSKGPRLLADIEHVAAEAMHCGTVANPIRVMHREHSDEGLRYKFIRNLMNDYAVPADACPSYRLMLEDLERFMDALFEHIHLENNILFPRFVALEQSCVRGYWGSTIASV